MRNETIFEFIRYAGTHDNKCVKILSAPGLWMQRITTVEPTDDIIEVGIASLKAALYGVDEDEEESVQAVDPETEIEEDPVEAECVEEDNVTDVEDDFIEDEIVEQTQEVIKEIEEAEEEIEEIEKSIDEEITSSDYANKSVDEMMEELFKETSFNDEV